MSTKQTFKIVNGVYTGPEHWKGVLYLRGYKETLTSLGNLETVGWSIDLEGCSSLTNLGNLETVGGWLDLEGCSSLTTLGNLKTVRWWLELRGCSNLTSLGNLEKVSTISLHENKEVSLKDVQDKTLHYSAMQVHEALNAIHIQEVQETPLYRNILTEILQNTYKGF